MDNTMAPTVTHVIANAVMVCSCPNKSLMVLNILGGEIQCPSCKQRFYSPRMSYTIDRATKTISIECVTDVVPSENTIDVFDSLSLANLKLLPPGRKQ